MHMRPGMYFSCVDPHESRWGGLPPFLDEYQKLLGPAQGPARQVSHARWVRTFAHPDLNGAVTTVTYDTAAKHGNISWADGPARPPYIWPGGPPTPSPPGPPPGPQPPPPPICGALLRNTAVANTPDSVSRADSVAECCSQCDADPKCEKWAWHAEMTPRLCHRHARSGVVHPKRGCFAGVMNRTVH